MNRMHVWNSISHSILTARQYQTKLHWQQSKCRSAWRKIILVKWKHSSAFMLNALFWHKYHRILIKKSSEHRCSWNFPMQKVNRVILILPSYNHTLLINVINARWFAINHSSSLSESTLVPWATKSSSWTMPSSCSSACSGKLLTSALSAAASAGSSSSATLRISGRLLPKDNLSLSMNTRMKQVRRYYSRGIFSCPADAWWRI